MRQRYHGGCHRRCGRGRSRHGTRGKTERQHLDRLRPGRRHWHRKACRGTSFCNKLRTNPEELDQLVRRHGPLAAVHLTSTAATWQSSLTPNRNHLGDVFVVAHVEVLHVVSGPRIFRNLSLEAFCSHTPVMSLS